MDSNWTNKINRINLKLLFDNLNDNFIGIFMSKNFHPLLIKCR